MYLRVKIKVLYFSQSQKWDGWEAVGLNVQVLKRKILDCGYNIVEFSGKVSIDRSTFYQRVEKM